MLYTLHTDKQKAQCSLVLLGDEAVVPGGTTSYEELAIGTDKSLCSAQIQSIFLEQLATISGTASFSMMYIWRPTKIRLCLLGWKEN